MLNGFLSHGPYADYIHATEKVHEAIETVEGSWAAAKGAPPKEELRALQAAVKSWLSALRSFDDRMSAWLSKHFGKGDVYRAFKTELSAEYDNNFAYRLSYGLRNASEHEAPVLNHVRFHSAEQPDGTRRDRVDLGFDTAMLAKQFNEMKASLRQELRVYGGLVCLEAVVGHATQAVERSMAAALTAGTVDVERALETVEDLHAEAVAAGGKAANFMTSVGPQGGEIDLQWVEIHIAQAVRGNLEASTHLLAIDRGQTVPGDLAL